MRTLAWIATAAAAWLMSATPGDAFDGPWCAIINFGGGVVQEKCSMPDFETCRREAMIFGPTSFCRPNGYYLASPPAKAPRRGKKSRRPR